MWSFEHSVHCPVNRDFAWQFWSDFRNTSTVDPVVEAMELHGPFEPGTKGTTRIRGGGSVDWTLVDVNGTTATFEIAMDDALMRFHWTFETASGGGTTISQLVTLTGAQTAHLQEAAREFEGGIPQGMKRLVEAIVAAAKNQSPSA